MSDGEPTDQEAVLEKRRQRAADARRQAEEDLKAVMGQSAGRRFVWRLLESATGVFGTSFTGEALTSAHEEGKRSVGVALMAEVQRVDADSYVAMLREQLDARLEASLGPGSEEP